MTIVEIAKAISEMLERETVPLANVPQILESYGHLGGEEDRRGRCRAIIAMMRQILVDGQVAELLDLTIEVHALRSVQELFDIETAPMLTETYWKELDVKVREVDQRVVKLREVTNRKVVLLGFLATKLAELKCDEDWVLPKLPMGLLPMLHYPA